MTTGCAEKLNMSIVSASMCEDIQLSPATNGVCYNGSVPYAIYNASIAKVNNITAVVPTQEYLVYV